MIIQHASLMTLEMRIGWKFETILDFLKYTDLSLLISSTVLFNLTRARPINFINSGFSLLA